MSKRKRHKKNNKSLNILSEEKTRNILKGKKKSRFFEEFSTDKNKLLSEVNPHNANFINQRFNNIDEDKDYWAEEDKNINQWIDEQLVKNISVDEFNEDEDNKSLGFYLEISEGVLEKWEDQVKVQNYEGKCLFLYNKAKSYILEQTPYDENNPMIPREIFEAVAYW